MPESDYLVEIALPSEPLRPYLSAYFIAEFDTSAPIIDHSVPEWGAIRFIHEGGFDLAVTRNETLRVDRAYVQGPSAATYSFSMQKCRVLGIGLFPAGFARFWDLDLSDLGNGWKWLHDLFGDSMNDLEAATRNAASPQEQFALVDQYFLDLLNAGRANHQTNLVQQIHKIINNPEIERIEQIADALHVSTSTVTRVCKQRFGFPPKQLLRRQRFLRMLEALHARPYSEWPDYIDPQYVDQSHMIRDFKYFMGMSPGQYLALPRPVQQKSATARAAAVGRALQGVE